MTADRDSFDRRRFPAMAAYLDKLPSGLDSYPDCQVRAVFLRSIADEYSLLPLCSVLPPILAELLSHLPPSSSWISQVHFRCLLRVLLDEHFSDEAAMLAWSYASQSKLLGGPLYRVMFALLSPERAVRLAPQRWGHFHRGLTLEVDASRGRAQGILRHPRNLYQRLDHGLSLAGMRAVLELSGAKDVRTEQQETGPTQSRGLLIWS